jgi:Na+/H+-translocating membrane pyrophosphatase
MDFVIGFVLGAILGYAFRGLIARKLKDAATAVKTEVTKL